jgi:Kef-type K+ transport system membrane component KefB
MLAVGMLVGPIPRKWDEAPAAGLKFFRWYTYNNDHEVIWRANFTVFAFGNLLVAVNPVKNLSIILYFGCHGIMHSLTMLVDNRADVNGNGNWEHLVEIFVFLIWGIISLIHVKRMIQMQEDDKVVNSIPYR